MTSIPPIPESEVIEEVLRNFLGPTYRKLATERILTALSRQGLCAVPREPTEAMIRAAIERPINEAANDYAKIWAAMIEADARRIEERTKEANDHAEAANRWRNQWGEAMAALEGVLSIPALNQVLGTKHTADCDCPLCRARALLQPQPERSEYLDEKDRT